MTSAKTMNKAQRRVSTIFKKYGCNHLLRPEQERKEEVRTVTQKYNEYKQTFTLFSRLLKIVTKYPYVLIGSFIDVENVKDEDETDFILSVCALCDSHGTMEKLLKAASQFACNSAKNPSMIFRNSRDAGSLICKSYFRAYLHDSVVAMYGDMMEYARDLIIQGGKYQITCALVVDFVLQRFSDIVTNGPEDLLRAAAVVFNAIQKHHDVNTALNALSALTFLSTLTPPMLSGKVNGETQLFSDRENEIVRNVIKDAAVVLQSLSTFFATDAYEAKIAASSKWARITREEISGIIMRLGRVEEKADPDEIPDLEAHSSVHVPVLLQQYTCSTDLSHADVDMLLRVRKFVIKRLEDIHKHDGDEDEGMLTFLNKSVQIEEFRQKRMKLQKEFEKQMKELDKKEDDAILKMTIHKIGFSEFGAPLSKIRFIDIGGLEVPQVLEDMKTHLVLKDGLSQKNIFAISGDKNVRDAAQKQVDAGDFSCDVHIISDLIKLFYRKLKRCLLADLHLDDLENMNAEDALQKMKEPYLSMLIWLLDLCVEVLLQHEQNEMTADSLATVFVPIVLEPSEFNASEDRDVVSVTQKVHLFMWRLIRKRWKEVLIEKKWMEVMIKKKWDIICE